MKKPAKTTGVLFNKQSIKRAHVNVKKYAWAKQAKKEIVAAAEPWLKMSDEKLWSLVFGPTIKRAWHVWSSGHCPSCKESVPMYNWKMNAMKRVWKVTCPHCKEIFPKNDFQKYYKSGLDQHGIFDPKKADKKLLFNTEHPDPKDPLHKFGVDDGNGFVQKGKRWRFIGAYLIYGHWKQLIVEGCTKLGAAYVINGDPVYARKAGILLDRIADLYPSFDFGKQGIMYEGKGDKGYVSTWHDACEETRKMAIAYDQVFDAIKLDKALISFLSKKATKYKLKNPKSSFIQIQENIENRILRDALKNQHKIHSNYPRKEIAVAVIQTVLDWPNNRDQVMNVVGQMIRRSTKVDGVTGEKGLSSYSAYVIQGLAAFLGEFDRMDPKFLSDIFKQYPVLHQTYRFHIDTWINQNYYPLIGDAGFFAGRISKYQGVLFTHPWDIKDTHSAATLKPSPFSFMWNLYLHTGDVALAQVIHHSNGGKVTGLPFDLFAKDPAVLQKKLKAVITREGKTIKLGSINKEQWHMAILRSGKGEDGRAAWMAYDTGKNHGHWDGLNLGLIAKGLNLMPDFGYPPVQFGGWNNAKANWYRNTASHNTVVVDGKNHNNGAGKTTLWGAGEHVSMLRVSCPQFFAGKQFERTIATVDISSKDFYMLDIFRVVGGKDHAKFMSSTFGSISTAGLNLKKGVKYGHGTFMQNFKTDAATKPGWSAEWDIDDYYSYLPKGTELHLKVTDLTSNAQASTCEAWINAGTYKRNDEKWIPRLMIRRQSPKGSKTPLASTFVSVIEPFGKTSNIATIKRLDLHGADGKKLADSFVAIEISLTNGRRDLFVTTDKKMSNKKLIQKDWALELTGDTCLIQKDAKVKILSITGKWRALKVDNFNHKPKAKTDYIEKLIK